MARVKAGNSAQLAPANISQWKPIPTDPHDPDFVIPLEIQNMGKLAVDEQNRRHGLNMAFVAVYGSWYMILSANSGKLYLFVLKALDDVDLGDYEVIVWVRPKRDFTAEIACSNLKLHSVVGSWVIALASDSSDLDLLQLKALKRIHGVRLFIYQAVVWEKPKQSLKNAALANCCDDPKTLVSFQEISPSPQAA